MLWSETSCTLAWGLARAYDGTAPALMQPSIFRASDAFAKMLRG